jgi:uncharacterized protein (TIGR02145 family)
MKTFRQPVLFLLLAAGAILLTTCRKDPFGWKPEVSLAAKPDSGLTTQTFDFRVAVANLPSGQEEFYVRWDLDGDSTWDQPFSSDPAIPYRFYKKGDHVIRAEILTEDGQRIFLKKKIAIAQGYSAPHAAFTIDPPVGNYLNKFTFDAGATRDDEDSLATLKFRWDFDDDGRWETDYSSDPKTVYQFKKALNYNVRLSVMDPTKRVASEVKTLIVDMHEDAIRPDFSWLPAEATVKDTFLLDASATRHETDSARVFTYEWDIKSEVVYGPFEEPVFEHLFRASGMQQVTLTATDQYGLSNSITKEFYVIKENRPPVPKIQVGTPYGNVTTNFYLSSWPSTDDVTAPSQMLVRWDFEGDGNWDTDWSYDKVVYHQFPVPGEYRVVLEATDEGGISARGYQRVLVSPYAVETGWFIDRRDGKFYGTVKIGSQWWMSDNLDYRTNPKMDIPMLQKCYKETEGMCNLYGALYQGARAVDYTNSGQNICPDGWRLPTRQDWEAFGKHVPETGGRVAVLVGGSSGFNARFTGSGYISWDYTLGGKVARYNYSGLYDEVKYLSLTMRPFQSEYQAQFYMGLLRISDEVDLRWGNSDGYFYIRCLKDD